MAPIFCELAKRINEYTCQLLAGPNALWPWPTRSLPRSVPMESLGSAVSVSSPGGVRGRAPITVAFCCIVCSQNASGCSIFGSLVNIAMNGKMKANPGSGRIWYLLATRPYKHHSRSNWQVNFCRAQICGP